MFGAPEEIRWCRWDGDFRLATGHSLCEDARRRFVVKGTKMLKLMNRPGWALVASLLFLGAGCVASQLQSGGAGNAAGGTQVAPGDPAHSLLKASTFEDGVMLPWMTSFSAPATGEAEVKDGALCVRVNEKGKNRWDAQVRHREIVIQKGHDYTLSFKAWSSRKIKAVGKVGMSGPPYTDYWSLPVSLDTTPQQFSYKFTMGGADDPTAELAFHFGGHLIEGPGPIDLCFDNLILSDASFTPPPPAPKVVVPAVRVNQLGYAPSWTKLATLVTKATGAQDWQLLDSAGKAVAKGKTQPFGTDSASGDTVQLIDFSTVTAPGKGYVLAVGGDKSDPFEIEPGLYSGLKKDALHYFYQTRSGIEIKMPYAGRQDLARPAGHPKDEVSCAPEAKCNYKLDVTGGWYDAGDYGKYVVNGGISAWTLMNWYERTKFMGGAPASIADGKDVIPESGNKTPDVLDEARWEVGFLLKMQVPDGQPNAGLVHHKMHDVDWSGLGIAPHESKMNRALRPVSTAATLNLAAAAAQAARLFKTFDPAFSQKCLKAAEKAYAAAKAHPKLLAPVEDNKGGGPYEDKDVSDEFYWAAAELYATTDKDEYLKDVKSSSLNGPMLTAVDPTQNVTSMTWQRVSVPGKITLALVPSKLPHADRDALRAQIQKLAEQYLAVEEKQGYRLPLAAGSDGYAWGSNSDVLNNAMILALAYDFTKDKKFLDGTVEAMDYVLGRNALGQSYVTGYGVRALKNPHHRFWSHQANEKYPSAPPGIVSGGPNSGLQDPYVKAAGLKGCAPQKCWVDHIEAWSANEITINWNAPLAWVAFWLDEHAR